jgi:hypothetical protein
LGNFQTFASVTATIAYILEGVNKDVHGIKITTRPLDALETANPTNSLNILLYSVTSSPSVGSIDLMIKDPAGDVVNNPSLLLELHYLITATAADNNDLISQQILASAMKLLNEYPILTKEIIQEAVSTQEILKTSDLKDQVERVKLSIEPVSIDEITKVWSRFPNANFRTSVTYVASAVILESKMVAMPPLIKSIVLDEADRLTPVESTTRPSTT